MKRKTIFTILIIVGIAGITFFLYTGQKEDNARAVEGEAIIEEHIDDFHVVEAFGVVKVKNHRNFTLNFSAKILGVYIENGDLINQGDSLIKLDITEQKLELKNLERNLRIAENDLLTIKENYQLGNEQLLRSLENEERLLEKESLELKQKKAEYTSESSPDFKNLKNELITAQRLLEEDQRELKEKEKLYQAGAITQYNLNELSKKVELQEDSVKAADLALENLRFNKQEEIKDLEKALEIKTNKIDELKTQSKQQEIDFQRSHLSKKMDIEELHDKIGSLIQDLTGKEFLQDEFIIADIKKGIVYDLNLKKGDLIQPGNKLLSIMDLSEIVIEANVPEEFIADVKIGAGVTIIPLAFSDREYHGQVKEISNLALKKGGETIVPVEISIKDRDDSLLPNFNVDVEILTN